MTNRLSRRFWVETALAVISTVALVMTIITPDWIERIVGFEPDGGDGSTEWGLAISLAVVTIIFTADAWRVRSRSAQVSAATE